MYDRLTGGTTMIISSSGTTVPGSPIRPDYLKASVYLPPAFVAHHPDLHSNIIDIVQQFLETVGVRTVTMWAERARHDLKYSLTQRGNPQPNPCFYSIPNPDPTSAHYTFLGQPYRFIQDSSTTVRDPSPVTSVASYDFGEDPDPLTLLNLDLQQENGELRDQIKALQQKITDLELFSRYGQTPSTPSHVQPSREYTPSEYGSPTPDTPSKSRFHLGTSNVSRSPLSTSRTTSNATAELAPVYEPVFWYYINLYNLQDMSAALDLIFIYTPASKRNHELHKLGLNEDICDALTKAMALDNGMVLSTRSGRDNIE